MKIIRLEQETPEWLEWRFGGLGGSDANVIMGVSPYKTREQLLQEKRGGFKELTRTCNRAQLYGKRNEPAARAECEKLTGEIYQPVCGEHDSIPWLLVSLDGMNFEGDVILEVKCCNAKLHKYAERRAVPPQYWPQVQHALMVSEAKECHYYSRHKGKGLLVPVLPDSRYQATMIKELHQFWMEVTG